MTHFNINQHFKNDQAEWQHCFGLFIGTKSGTTNHMIQMSTNILHRFGESFYVSKFVNRDTFTLDEKVEFYGKLNWPKEMRFVPVDHLFNLCEILLNNSHSPEKSTLLIIDGLIDRKIMKEESFNEFVMQARKKKVTILLSTPYVRCCPPYIRYHCDFVVFGGSRSAPECKYVYQDFFDDNFPSANAFRNFQSMHCVNNQYIVKTLNNPHSEIFTYSTQNDQQIRINKIKIITRFLKSCKLRRFKKWLKSESTLQWLYSPNQIGGIFATRDLQAFMQNKFTQKQ